MRTTLFPVRSAAPGTAGTFLSSRRHIDLQRVNSAVCPTA
ncbi:MULTISPECIES: putative leader peptide [unclassified Streptomyces]|nr:putative leader peptide [Streptomyces sp. NBC_00103]